MCVHKEKNQIICGIRRHTLFLKQVETALFLDRLFKITERRDGSFCTVWGFITPVESGILDTAGNVSPSVLWLGGDVMSKAQAQKHRAVSLDTVMNTQSPERSGDFFYLNQRNEDIP